MLTASVTNTSADELDGSIDYTARFTRGDSSRTDGGSGLGLSIARSFTEPAAEPSGLLLLRICSLHM